MPEDSLEIPIEQIYRPGSALDMPIRPSWTYDMTKEQLEQQEQTYFNVRRGRRSRECLDQEGFFLGLPGQNLCEFRRRKFELPGNEFGNVATIMANG